MLVTDTWQPSTRLGQLYTWGHNGDGQLGQGNTTQLSNPTQVSGFNNVVDVVATGGYNTTDGDTGNIFVLKADGTVWTSGNGQFGQLGNGTLVSTSTFVQATGLTNITKIYAAPTHWGAYAFAVNASGQVYAVGANAVGNLGTGNTTQYSTYQPISGGFTGKVAKIVLASNAMISSSYAFSYILDTDGNVWATGYNLGQLGTGSTPNLSTFTKMQKSTNGAKALDIRAMGYGAGSGIAAVITQDDGTMMGIGLNNFGQTGTDANSNSSVYNFKYVLGFGPGQNASQFSGGLVPFNLLTGAQLGNVVDNLNFTQEVNWSTASNTNALLMSANSLTSGNLQTLTTNSTLFSGALLNISSTGDSASSTGSLVKLDVVGVNSSSTALKITNAGTGLSVDVTGGLALRAGSDFSAVGTTNDAPFGNASLIRLTGATAQTFTGIAGGTNGLLLTLMNAGAATTTLQNDNGASIAANRIITGTNADLEIKAGGSIMLQYDGTSQVWRVIGGTGGGSSGITYLATSSQNYIPVLMNEEAQFGMSGQAFIYRNQIYTMGNGAANRPYGINGDTNTGNAAIPSLLPIASNNI
jgi:hypothetical protein